MRKSPTFTAYLGPMFSGKTSRLIAHVDRLRHQRRTVACFKPTIDDRYAECKIVTHSGISIPAVGVSKGADILGYLASQDGVPDVIAVDEAWMVPDCADALVSTFRMGITVVVSSIELSAACVPFREIERLLPWVTHVEKCTAVCACGQDAAYSYMKVPDDRAVVIGGSDLYEARCFSCHPLMGGSAP